MVNKDTYIVQLVREITAATNGVTGSHNGASGVSILSVVCVSVCVSLCVWVLVATTSLETRGPSSG